MPGRCDRSPRPAGCGEVTALMAMAPARQAISPTPNARVRATSAPNSQTEALTGGAVTSSSCIRRMVARDAWIWSNDALMRARMAQLNRVNRCAAAAARAR